MSLVPRLRSAVSAAALTLALGASLPACALTDGMDPGLPAPPLAVDGWVIDAPHGANDVGDLRGRDVLIEFWSMKCPHCRDEVPEIQRLHETYGPQGLVVLSVHVPLGNRESSPREVAAYAQRNGITYAIGYDADGSSTDAYQYGYLPHAVLVDPTGRVSWSGSLSLYDVEDEIRSALGASVARSVSSEAMVMAPPTCTDGGCLVGTR